MTHQDTQPPAETLADHFAVGCWYQPDGTYAGECACGATFRGDTYRAAKVAWAEHAAPTPSAGGDAEMKGWDHRYRPLAWGEVILDTDECRRDDGTWVTGICVGQTAPDPAYTSHRVYRRLVAPAGGDARADYRLQLATALFQATHGARLIVWSDGTRDYWLKRADAALAPATEGLHPIQTVEGLKRLWKIGVETGRILQAHESVLGSTKTEPSSERSTCNAHLQVVPAIEQAVARFACTNWDDAARHDLTREILVALGLDTPDVERRWNHFDVARDMLDRSYGSGLDAVTDARRTDPIAAAIHNAALVTIVRALKGSHH